MAIFFTDHSTRHSLLLRKRAIREKKSKGLLRSANPGTLSDWIVPRGDGATTGDESSTTPIALEPGASDSPIFLEDDAANQPGGDAPIVFSELSPRSPGSPTGSREGSAFGDGESDMEDKKKIRFNTTYSGFSIYGRILSLVVKRVDPVERAAAEAAAAAAALNKPKRGRGKATANKPARSSTSSKAKQGPASAAVSNTVVAPLEMSTGGDVDMDDDDENGTAVETGTIPAATMKKSRLDGPANMIENWISTQVARGHQGHDDDDD